MSVEIKYTNASGKSQTIKADSPSSALRRLSAIPGYINRDADALTGALGGSLKERRKQRATDFAAGHHADAMNPSSSKRGVGTSDILLGFGGLIVEDGVVVGAKIYDMKFVDGQLVGTGGMREERIQARSEEDIRKSWLAWWGDWWRTNWRDYAYWM